MNNSPELDESIDVIAFNIVDNSKKMSVPLAVLSNALKGVDVDRKQKIIKQIPNDILINLYHADPTELPVILEDMDQEKLASFLHDFLSPKSVDEHVTILHFCYGVFTTNIANLCENISSEVFLKLVFSPNKLSLPLFVYFFQKLDEPIKWDLMRRIEIDRLRTILLDPFFNKVQDIDDLDELTDVMNYIPEERWPLIVNHDDIYLKLEKMGLSDYLQENTALCRTDDASSCSDLEHISSSAFFSFLSSPAVRKIVAIGLVIGVAGLLSIAAIGVLGAIGMVAIAPTVSLIPALIMVGIGLLSLAPPVLVCANGSETIPRLGLAGYFFPTSPSIARADSTSENISLSGLSCSA